MEITKNRGIVLVIASVEDPYDMKRSRMWKTA